MRFLKIAFAGLVTAIAMLFSLLFACGVALIGILVYLYIRMRGRSTAQLRRQDPNDSAPRPAEGDVIDVSATEISSDRLKR